MILASSWLQSVGVEVVEGLHETAMVLLDRWEEGKQNGPLEHDFREHVPTIPPARHA